MRAAENVILHHMHRHNFAHWAARRVRHRDILILWTYNAREAEKRDQKPIGPGELKFGLVPRIALIEQFAILEGHSKYLAEAAAHLHTHLGELERDFAARREAERAEKYQNGVERGRRKGQRRQSSNPSC
jgi:hypothetical protein